MNRGIVWTLVIVAALTSSTLAWATKPLPPEPLAVTALAADPDGSGVLVAMIRSHARDGILVRLSESEEPSWKATTRGTPRALYRNINGDVWLISLVVSHGNTGVKNSYFLSHFGSGGKRISLQPIRLSPGDHFSNFAVTADGNAYIVGSALDATDRSTGKVAVGWQPFVARHATNGLIRWIRHWTPDPSSWSNGSTLTIEASGTIAIAGSTKEGIFISRFDSQGNTLSVTRRQQPGFALDVFRIDSAGVVTTVGKEEASSKYSLAQWADRDMPRWERDLGFRDETPGQGTYVDDHGNTFLLTSRLRGNERLLHLEKWNAHGAKKWEYPLPLPVLTAGSRDHPIAVSRAGDIFVAGEWEPRSVAEWNEGNLSVVRVSPDGQVLWKRPLGALIDEAHE